MDFFFNLAPELRLFIIGFIHFLDITTPGRNFILVATASYGYGSALGYRSAAGIAFGEILLMILGIILFGILGDSIFAKILLGVGIVNIVFYWARAFSSMLRRKQLLAAKDAAAVPLRFQRRGFTGGVLQSLTYPSGIFYFVCLLPAFVPVRDGVVPSVLTVGMIAGLSFLWFCFIALIMGQRIIRSNPELFDQIRQHIYAQISPLPAVLTTSLRILTEHLQNAIDLRVNAELGRQALQIAHDIRSPLAALSVLEREMVAMSPEAQELARGALTRIRGISKNLLEHQQQSLHTKVGPLPLALICEFIESLIKEKRLEFSQNGELDLQAMVTPDCKDESLLVDPVELQRILSNLINNSLEAGGNKITLSVLAKAGEAEIKVADSGKGIAPDILKKLGQPGFSHGKSSGHGLGLHHAKTTIEKWNGRLLIESTVNAGTKVKIILPLQKGA